MKRSSKRRGSNWLEEEKAIWTGIWNFKWVLAILWDAKRSSRIKYESHSLTKLWFCTKRITASWWGALLSKTLVISAASSQATPKSKGSFRCSFQGSTRMWALALNGSTRSQDSNTVLRAGWSRIRKCSTQPTVECSLKAKRGRVGAIRAQEATVAFYDLFTS